MAELGCYVQCSCSTVEFDLVKVNPGLNQQTCNASMAILSHDVLTGGGAIVGPASLLLHSSLNQQVDHLSLPILSCDVEDGSTQITCGQRYINSSFQQETTAST